MKKMIFAVLAIALLHAGAALAAVNINTADKAALASLDGVGQVKAEAIMKYREDNGDFASVDDLAKVSGIGSKTVDGLRDEATVGEDG